ncbi:MAG: hypothetical protein LUG99_22710 [Lachnospiraceae bacterium]|nr:hypothetical protein [Lachnospiraceae bacterium]
MAFIIALIISLAIGIIEEIQISQTAKQKSEEFKHSEYHAKLREIEAERERKIAEFNARYAK